MADIDRTLYQQLGELIAEMRGLRASIDSAQNQNLERFTRIEDRVTFVEGKVDHLDSILDRVRGASALAKAAYLAGGVAGGGAVASAVASLLR